MFDTGFVFVDFVRFVIEVCICVKFKKGLCLLLVITSFGR